MSGTLVVGIAIIVGFLAVIAGARPGDLLAGDDASGLPPPRESFVARAGEAAEQAAARRLYEADDEDDAEDWREDEGDGEDRRREDRGVGADDAENCGPETCGEEDQAGEEEEEEEEEADWRDPILAAGRAARVRQLSIGRW